MRAASLASLSGLVVHHLFERNRGLGLPLQPQLGRRGGEAFWIAATSLGVGLAVRRSRPSTFLAWAAGAQLATVLVHYANWPATVRSGLPRLLEAEGIPEHDLPLYNAVIQAWMLAALGAVGAEARGRAGWLGASAGLATYIPARRLARQHTAWLANDDWFVNTRGVVSRYRGS
jgi:hypothetical protein